MIPGWKIFFQGFACGIFTIGTVAQATRADVMGIVVCALLAAMCFFFGATNAEKLAGRPSNAKTGE